LRFGHGTQGVALLITHKSNNFTKALEKAVFSVSEACGAGDID
jgi:hypothetical protein